MIPLFEFQENIIRNVRNDLRRFLHQEIDWSQRMTGIKGPRGSGKTTMMLQYLKFDLGLPSNALYITADHTWFYNHSLMDTAGEWYKQGGKILIIDEVHKYRNWSLELKNIYDGFPDLKIIFSASSALDIFRGEADLSRRVISYTLPGLSFREFLWFTTGREFQKLSLEDIITNHPEASRKITRNFHPLPAFRNYVKAGYLPIILEGEDSYHLKLNQVINTVIETDLSHIAGHNAGTAKKLKRLLSVIAESVPFKPNIAALARKLDLSRDSVYQYIYQLNDSQLLNTLSSRNKGVSVLQKPDKIFLENTNLSYALQEKPDVGNLRETFVLNQLLNAGIEVRLPEQGDFMTGDLTIEVGGKGKTNVQVKHLDKYIIASDDIEIGNNNRIPIWLFGFLY